MPSVSITCGIVLILIGVLGYVYGLMTGHASITAFIPAIVGILLAILGFAARSKVNLRKHLMHAAVLIGLVGFLLPAVRLLSKLSELTFSASVLSQVLMALVCLLFVVLAVRSFIEARRNARV